MSRTLDSQLSFADLELSRLGVHLDPVLQGIDAFLDQHSDLVEQVRLDLERGLKNPTTGRNGITPSQTLRSLTLMRVKNWDYRELRERINDGYTLRGFTQFDSHLVPKHDAFNRAFNRLTPATLQAINQAVVQAAVQLGLEDGKRLRVDTTVVETNIHYPTDATLLWDSVRTITRLVEDLHDKLPNGVQGFTNRTRSARRRMQQIQRMTAQQRQQQQEPKYRELLRITGQVVQNARQVVEQTQGLEGIDVVAGLVIDQLRQEITSYCDLADRVIDQTRRRVLTGRGGPHRGEGLLDLRAPHGSDQAGQGSETGGIWPQGVPGRERPGIDHRLPGAEGEPRRQRPCGSLAGASPANLPTPSRVVRRRSRLLQRRQCASAASDAEVGQVCIPQRGGKKTAEQEALERSRAFKKAQRFRVGIEGRISVLFRGRGMKRCRAKGRERFEMLVGAAVLANNLMRIAQLIEDEETEAPPSRRIKTLPPPHLR